MESLCSFSSTARPSTLMCGSQLKSDILKTWWFSFVKMEIIEMRTVGRLVNIILIADCIETWTDSPNCTKRSFPLSQT